ncbi:Endonuclease/exonuclease/phosphatase [Pelagophyceae sp. CCMP2097]|nr:Endonuclease/exonuclease/phosphatase [Pelagophyceae sp. CCMP2097]
MELDESCGVFGADASAAHVAWLRAQWVAGQMEARLDAFARGVDCNVVCASWNVNGKNAPSLGVDLKPWLRAQGALAADLFAVGLQEMVDLTAVNVVADTKSAKRAEQWKDLLEQALLALGSPHGCGYELVAQKHMVGVLLVVYVRTNGALAGRVKNAASAVAGVGVMGMLGNKGGVSIRLQCYDTTLCFVCAHLAAHRENTEGRNSDFASICAKTEFRDVLVSCDDYAADESQQLKTVGILDHDIVFWLGDLNYRIACAVSTKEVFARSEAGDLAFLRANDQLNIERKAGRVFQGFNEAELTFGLTYKFEPGTSKLEQRPDKKLRTPAWCDRVLWKCRGGAKAEARVRCVEYDSAPELIASDHKPVRCVFAARVLECLPDRRRAAYLDVLRSLDSWTGDARPAVRISELRGDVEVDLRGAVDFGAVEFDSDAARTLRIRNVGAVVAHWRLVGSGFCTGDRAPAFAHAEDTPGAPTAVSKRWLSAAPAYGTLPPGAAVTIDLVIAVDTQTARALNSHADSLDDVIVVHVERGAEHVVHVTAQWLRSAWGMSLEDLCHCRGAARDRRGRGAAPADLLGDAFPAAAAPPPAAPAALAVPKELWRLVDALHARGRFAPNLFFTAGSEAEVRAIRAALDCDLPLSANASPYSVADALTSFLSALAKPVVPRALLPKMELADANELRKWARDFLARLPPASYNAFIYLVAFFRDLLQHSDTNSLTPTKVAAVVCNCMLPPDKPFAADEYDSAENVKPTALWMNTVVQYLLTTPSL